MKFRFISFLVVLHCGLYMHSVMCLNKDVITMVSVRVNSLDEMAGTGKFVHLCGGSLITTSVVFTGCSCITKKMPVEKGDEDMDKVELLAPDQVEVHAGVAAANSNKDASSQTSIAMALNMHALCDSTFTYNYGMIKLTNAFRLENGLELSHVLSLDMADFEKQMMDVKPGDCWTETWVQKEGGGGLIDQETQTVPKEEYTEITAVPSGVTIAEITEKKIIGGNTTAESNSESEYAGEYPSDDETPAGSYEEHSGESGSTDYGNGAPDDYYGEETNATVQPSNDASKPVIGNHSTVSPSEITPGNGTIGVGINNTANEPTPETGNETISHSTHKPSDHNITVNNVTGLPAIANATSQTSENTTLEAANATDTILASPRPPQRKRRDMYKIGKVNEESNESSLDPHKSTFLRGSERHKLRRRQANATVIDKSQDSTGNDSHATSASVNGTGSNNGTNLKPIAAGNGTDSQIINGTISPVGMKSTKGPGDSGHPNSNETIANTTDISSISSVVPMNGSDTTADIDKGPKANGTTQSPLSEPSESSESHYEEYEETASADAKFNGTQEGSSYTDMNGQDYSHDSMGTENINSTKMEDKTIATDDLLDEPDETESPVGPTGTLPTESSPGVEPTDTAKKEQPQRVGHLNVDFLEWDKCKSLVCPDPSVSCNDGNMDTKWCLDSSKHDVRLCLADTGAPVYCKSSMVAILSEVNLDCPKKTTTGVALGLDGAFEYIKSTMGMPDFAKKVAPVPVKARKTSDAPKNHIPCVIPIIICYSLTIFHL